MKLILKCFCSLLLVITVNGCKKFLSVRPDSTNDINPRTVTDFEEMLNNSTLATPNYLVADLVSDDIELSDKVLNLGRQNSFYVNAYLWADEVWTPTDDDPIYNYCYTSILQMNIVLDNIGKADGGTEERKEIVAAQAKINRAYYYLQLVNLYGKDYQPGTADKDLAVPLVLHPDATVLPERNTVQNIYDQILKDLNEAVSTTSLPDIGSDVIHPDRAAAFGMLARTYFFMGNFEAALTAAESALKIKHNLLDYRTFSFVDPQNLSLGVKYKPFSLWDQQRMKNPEIIFAKVCMDVGFYRAFNETLYLSRDLRQIVNAKDLRFKYGFMLGEQYPRYPTYDDNRATSMQFNYSIGVPEMMLIKAECLARKGQGTQALSIVNELRTFRFLANEYTPLVVNSSADALTLVLQERRRELFLHGGIRLFDLKRLNKDVKFEKELVRRSVTTNNIIATLKAGSPRYLMPFAPKIIANNTSIIQNER